MLLWRYLFRPLLFALEPEVAHDRAIRVGSALSSLEAGLAPVRWSYRNRMPVERRRLWGLEFRNPLGIAAGFDKNAEALPFLEALGFGFVEAGTVTLRPQSGNPKPRLFRYPRQRALINRLGFNNEGAEAVSGRLRAFVARESGTPLLINIGRNRDVRNEEAPEAYRRVYEVVGPFAHGTVVNISSPNTPGLRELQEGSALTRLLDTLLEQRERTTFETAGDHPLLLKVSPDLSAEQLGALVEASRSRVDGMVATNTTLDHEEIDPPADEQGGLSGRPLRQQSLEALRSIRRVAESMPLIGSGGIMDGSDALERLEAGASLVQVYTGLIYGGPGLPKRIVRAIHRASRRE